MLKLQSENTIVDIPDLNRFQIGDNVIVDATADYDRFEGVIIGIELRRMHGSNHLVPSITLLHDGCITDEFKPADCRKVSLTPPLRGVYIASKTKHAERWRRLRDAGFPIISTWIDEAGAGESGDLSDLWRRCILEASTASALILYREPEDVLKGGWVELGAALACGVPVLAVGIEEFTIAKDTRIRHFATLDAALAATAPEGLDRG